MREAIKKFVQELDSKFSRVSHKHVVDFSCNSTRDFYEEFCYFVGKNPRGRYQVAYAFCPVAYNIVSSIGIDDNGEYKEGFSDDNYDEAAEIIDELVSGDYFLLASVSTQQDGSAALDLAKKAAEALGVQENVSKVVLFYPG